MKNKLVAIFAAVCILFPISARADLDVLSGIQDVLSSAEEKVSVLVKQYTGLSLKNITAVTDRNYLRNMRDQVTGQLKDRAITALRSTSLNHFSMAGLKKNLVSGPYANSGLLRSVKKQYTRQTKQKNDYAATKEHNARQNRLMVENAATTLAKALVMRSQIIKDLEKLEKDEGKTYEQLTVIQEEYKQTVIRANNRWAKILVKTAEFEELNANGRLAEARIKPEDAEEDAEEDEGGEEETETEQAQNPENMMKNNITIGQAWDFANAGKGAFDTFSSGNISGGLKGLGGMAGMGGEMFSGQSSTLDKMATGFSKAGDAYNYGSGAVSAAESGNWSGVVGNVVGGAGSTIGGATGASLQDANGVVQAGFGVADGISGGGDIFDKMDAVSSGLSNAAQSGAAFSDDVSQAQAQAAERQARKSQQQATGADSESSTGQQ